MKKLSLIGLMLILTMFIASSAMANCANEGCTPKTKDAKPACETAACPKANAKENPACGTAACPKSAMKCPADCKKPCCAKKAACGTATCPKSAMKCPTNCKKPCCAKKAACGTATCPKSAMKCPADCKKPCCAKKATCGTAACPKSAMKCPANCKKTCCAKKATCGTAACPKSAMKCHTNCKKTCCAKKAGCPNNPATCDKAKTAACNGEPCSQTLGKKCGIACAKPCCGGVALFDGKTLKGFTQRGGKAKYKVKDGMIVGSTVLNTPNSFMCTEKNYSDFILHLDFKVDEKLNSGVQIRSNSLEDYKDGRVHGYQVEIDPSQSKSSKANFMEDGSPAPKDAPRSWTGGIYDESRRGWLNDLTKNPKARNAFKPGQWNHFMIIAKGDSIKTWVNGIAAADLKDSMTKKGFIALQVHNAKDEGVQIMWKNIYLKEINEQSCPKTAATTTK